MPSVSDRMPAHETAWLGRAKPDDPTVPTLVLLHGYGSHERDLIALVPAMQMLLRGVSARVIAVRASYPAAGRPRGFSWFPGSILEQPPAEAVAIVADRVAELIRGYTRQAVVLGFSQGMCAAITVLRRHPALIRGLVGLSGFMFDDAQPGDAELAVRASVGHGIPSFVGYDPADPLVPAFATRCAVDYLRTHAAMTERRYPGMGHSVAMNEITDVAAFLRTLLPG